MTHSTDEQFDLIVIGGGPAGSTLSTLVAMQGHNVLLLEGDRFPRYQIGESLLPSTIHGIVPMLGVSDEVQAAGFYPKPGATLLWGADPEPWSISFRDTLMIDNTVGHSYQVDRATFDHILLKNARKKGVDVREEHKVTGVLREGERVVGVTYRDTTGVARSARARYVADATGYRSQLYKEVGERVFSKFFENIALFGYYTGGKRLPDPHKGDILVAAFDKGWFWYIPLSDTLTSVGAVFSNHLAYKLKNGHEETLQEFIDDCPMIRKYLSGAQRVTEGEFGKVRVRKDYSYCNTRFWQPGLFLIGDAACFIDPILSTGVHMATYSALQAARSVNTCLRSHGSDAINEKRCFAEFEMRYRAEYARFYQFLVAFYDTNRNKDSYFWTARNMLNSKERGNGAFVRLIAGVSGGALESDGAAFFDARADTGVKVQSWISAMQSGVQTEQIQTSVDDYSDAYCMIPGFEGAEFQTTGLIPAADGFHWMADESHGASDGQTGNAPASDTAGAREVDQVELML